MIEPESLIHKEEGQKAKRITGLSIDGLSTSKFNIRYSYFTLTANRQSPIAYCQLPIESLPLIYFYHLAAGIIMGQYFRTGISVKGHTKCAYLA